MSREKRRPGEGRRFVSTALLAAVAARTMSLALAAVRICRSRCGAAHRCNGEDRNHREGDQKCAHGNHLPSRYVVEHSRPDGRKTVVGRCRDLVKVHQEDDMRNVNSQPRRGRTFVVQASEQCAHNSMGVEHPRSTCLPMSLVA